MRKLSQTEELVKILAGRARRHTPDTRADQPGHG